jgi:hypothetical protein
VVARWYAEYLTRGQGVSMTNALSSNSSLPYLVASLVLIDLSNCFDYVIENSLTARWEKEYFIFDRFNGYIPTILLSLCIWPETVFR